MLKLVDIFSKEKRSWVMSRIRGRDTQPEMVVRSLLHRLGFRFRVHVSSLPGKPDIALPRFKTVIFVHGCFWHHHANCRNANYPDTRAKFWRDKIDGTVARDQQKQRQLRRLGWRVFTVWECQLSNPDAVANRFMRLIRKP
jgi:DNA mismatch endonuclease, patch repair protein